MRKKVKLHGSMFKGFTSSIFNYITFEKESDDRLFCELTSHILQERHMYSNRHLLNVTHFYKKIWHTIIFIVHTFKLCKAFMILFMFFCNVFGLSVMHFPTHDRTFEFIYPMDYIMKC